MLNGVFPKSECKGIDFSDILQIFRELFLKIYRLLIQIKQKCGFLGIIGHKRHIRRERNTEQMGIGIRGIMGILGGEGENDRIDIIDGDRQAR